MERKIQKFEDVLSQWETSLEYFNRVIQTPYRTKDKLIEKIIESGVTLINRNTWWAHYTQVGLIVRKEGAYQFALNYENLHNKVKAAYKLAYPSVKESTQEPPKVVTKSIKDFSTKELIDELKLRGSYTIKENIPNNKWISVPKGFKVQIIREFIVE